MSRTHMTPHEETASYAAMSDEDLLASLAEDEREIQAILAGESDGGLETSPVPAGSSVVRPDGMSDDDYAVLVSMGAMLSRPRGADA